MKLKTWLLGTLLGIAPASASSAVVNNQTKNNKVKTTLVVKKNVKADSTGNSKDSMTVCLNQDSLDNAKALDNFAKAEYDMLCVVAHCEGVRLRAYWDNQGKAYTIGIGNCYRPDGKKVGPRDCIRSKEELMQYFKATTRGPLLQYMKKYLPLHKMSKDEIAAVGSFLFNCGPGVLCDKSKAPSEFAKKLTKFIETRDETAKSFVRAFMLAHNKAKGRTLIPLAKRRDLETRILFGDIVLDNQGELKLENSVNFSEVPLGGIYSTGQQSLPTDSLELKRRLDNMPGRSLNDSINHELNRLNSLRRNGKSR